ncbi:ankyrin repeat domain-containing protein [Candidatus Dependentiae bacterium]
MKKSVLLALFLSALFLPQQHIFSMKKTGTKILGTVVAIGECIGDLIYNDSFGHFVNKITNPIDNLTSPTNIFAAIRLNNISQVKRLIKKNKDVLHKKDKDGNTPLHYVASFGRDDLLFLLLENGAYVHVNEKNIHGCTPLYYAVGRKVAGIKSKEDLSLDLDTNWAHEHSPFCSTIHQRYKIIATSLIKYGARVNEKNNNGMTPLHTAMLCGRKKMAALLLENDACIDIKNNLGNTPLHLAVCNNRNEKLKWLIQCGADINIKNNQGNTPLHIAVYCKNHPLIEFLIKNDANINIKNGIGYTPVHYAIDNCANSKDCIQVVAFLIQHDADINTKNNKGDTPLHTAVLRAYLEECKPVAFTIIKLLVEKGRNININAENVSGYTPLKLALELPIAQEIIGYLLSNDAQEGKTIFEAVQENNIDRVKTLVRRNKSIVNQKADCWTPLLNPVADVGANGWTPLHFASFHGHKGLVAYLIKNEAHINVKTKKPLLGDSTPLSFAANREQNKRARHKEFTNLLRRNLYPFWQAPFTNYEKIVKLLLQYGAHVDFDPKKGNYNAGSLLYGTRVFYDSKNKLNFIANVAKRRQDDQFAEGKEDCTCIIKMVFLNSVNKIIKQRKDAESTLFGVFYNKVKSRLDKTCSQALKESLDVEVLASKCSTQKYIEKVLRKNDFCINKKEFNEHTMQMNLLSCQKNGKFADLIIL